MYTDWDVMLPFRRIGRGLWLSREVLIPGSLNKVSSHLFEAFDSFFLRGHRHLRYWRVSGDRSKRVLDFCTVKWCMIMTTFFRSVFLNFCLFFQLFCEIICPLKLKLNSLRDKDLALQGPCVTGTLSDKDLEWQGPCVTGTLRDKDLALQGPCVTGTFCRIQRRLE
jgi:hypothetical protein